MQPPATQRLLVPGSVLVAALVLLFAPLPLGSDSAVVRELTNALHLPFFALVALACWLLVRRGTRLPFGRALAVSVGLGVVMAAGSELVQGASGREPSWTDLTNNLVGVAVVHGAVLAWARRGVWVWVAAGAVVLGGWIASIPVWKASQAYARLERRLPLVGDFEQDWERLLWHPQGGPGGERTTIEIAGGGGRRRLRVDGRGIPWGGVYLLADGADWSGYEGLEFELEIDGAPPPLGLRIDVAGGARYRAGVALKPGRERYRVAFEQFRGPDREPLREGLSAIGRLVFHFGEDGFRGTYLLDKVSLR